MAKIEGSSGFLGIDGEVIRPGATVATRPVEASVVRLESCAACRCAHFDPANKPDARGILTGQCRVKAPMAAIFPIGQNQIGQLSTQTVSNWPVVRSDQFCIDDFKPMAEGMAQ